MLEDIQKELIDNFQNEIYKNQNIVKLQTILSNLAYDNLFKPFRFVILIIFIFLILLFLIYLFNLYINIQIYRILSK